MDSFELNKIIGAILGTLLFVMGVGFVAEAVYEPRETGPGLSLPEPEGTDHGGEVVEVAAVPIGVLLASSNAEAGAAAARKCQGCHDFSEASTNKQGPGLYDVVERVIGSHAGFAYSPIMQEHAATGDTWTYDHLNAFLLAPKAHMPGTKMQFSGVKNDAERANIIAYLASLSASPKPFPPADVPAAVEGTETVTDADVVATPTTTQGETAVEGTPTTSGTEAAPAAPAATDPAAPTATEPAQPAAGQ